SDINLETRRASATASSDEFVIRAEIIKTSYGQTCWDAKVHSSVVRRNGTVRSDLSCRIGIIAGRDKLGIAKETVSCRSKSCAYTKQRQYERCQKNRRFPC